MSRTSITIAALITTAAASGFETPAFAGPPDSATRIVSYADLDLSRPAGRARLQQRIDSAVRLVCTTAVPTDLRSLLEARRCRTESLARVAADRRIGRVYVSQLGSALPEARDNR